MNLFHIVTMGVLGKPSDQATLGFVGIEITIPVTVPVRLRGSAVGQKGPPRKRLALVVRLRPSWSNLVSITTRDLSSEDRVGIKILRKIDRVRVVLGEPYLTGGES